MVVVYLVSSVFSVKSLTDPFFQGPWRVTSQDSPWAGEFRGGDMCRTV